MRGLSTSSIERLDIVESVNGTPAGGRTLGGCHLPEGMREPVDGHRRDSDGQGARAPEEGRAWIDAGHGVGIGRRARLDPR